MLAYNCVEWLEIYAATAKAGLVAVPINFRLVGAGDPLHRRELRGRGAHRRRTTLVGVVEEIRADLPVPAGATTSTSAAPLPRRVARLRGRCSRRRGDREPAVAGGAGRPVDADVHVGHHGQAEGRHPQPRRQRAAVARHRDRARARTGDDAALLVMPMCHANSLYFFGAFTYCGGGDRGLRSRQSFDPEHCLHDAGRRQVDVHLAGADALHHDAGAAGRACASATTSAASPS